MSSEKHGLETGAVTEFSEALVSEIGPGRFAFERLLDPPMPDALCSLDGQPLHVEITHVYGTESDVKRLLGRTGRSAPKHEEEIQSATMPLDGRLLIRLNEVLASKVTKSYAASRGWLLIRSGFPLWSAADFKEHRTQIHVPAKHPFEEIWLLGGPRSSFGLLRIA